MEIDVAPHLLLALDGFLSKQGFELILSKQQFRKQGTHGFQNIIPTLSTYEQAQETLVEFNLGVRLDIVEDLVNQFTQHLADFQADTNTLLTSMGRLLDKPFLRFNIKNESDVQQVSQNFMQFMEQQGFKFLDHISKLAHLEQLTNQNPDQVHPYFYNNYHRCLKGLTLARLNHRTDFETLAQIYQRQLLRRNAPPVQQNNFKKLHHYLSHFSVN